MIDEIDRKILDILQKDGRTSNAAIARAVEMAPSAVFERVRKLEQQRLIAGYEARLDARALGFGLLAFVFVRARDRAGEISAGERLARIPEVLEIHHIAGEDCFLLKVRAADTEALGRLLRERLGEIESVVSTRTTIVLETVKESGRLPLAASGRKVRHAS